MFLGSLQGCAGLGSSVLAPCLYQGLGAPSTCWNFPFPVPLTGRWLENVRAQEKPRFPSHPHLAEIKPEIEPLWRAEQPSPPLPE